MSQVAIVITFRVGDTGRPGSPCPAYVLTRTSDLLAANPEALILFAGLADWPAERRNTIRYTFLHPAIRRSASLP
jgi:hypothetical protein